MEFRFIPFKGKRTFLVTIMKMIATQRGSCQDHSRITGRWVSQLKQHLCYDNFNFDKKHYGKLNQAGVSDIFALVFVEIYL
jgi:hypothetical protein